MSFESQWGGYSPPSHEFHIWSVQNCRTQIKFFLKKLHHICSSDFQTFYFCRHFYEVHESDYIFGSRRFGHWKTRKTTFFLVFDRLFDVFYRLYRPQYNFVLFQTKSMDLCSDFEPFSSSVGQKLAPVAPRKFLMKNFFFEKVRFFRNFCFFRKIENFAKTSKLRESRVLVVWSSYGAHCFRNCLYFAFGIK